MNRRPFPMATARSSLLAFGMVPFFLTLPPACAPQGLLIRPVNVSEELAESVVMRDGRFTRDRIVVLDVDGLLLNAHQPKLFGQGEHPVSLLAEQLQKAASDKRVKGVILRINSPGGTVTASELMYGEIRGFKAATGKPIYAVMMDVAASGGYYVACACDRLYAQSSTITGSIGVIFQLFDASGTLQKIGLKSNAVTSGPRKDSGSPFKPMGDEERTLFQAMVDDLYAQFVHVVDEGRPGLDEAQVRALADGRVYTARQAFDAGLIDAIGTLQTAVADMKKALGVKHANVTVYHRQLDYRPTVYASAPPAGAEPQSTIERFEALFLEQVTSPRFLYLWQPGFLP